MKHNQSNVVNLFISIDGKTRGSNSGWSIRWSAVATNS